MQEEPRVLPPQELLQHVLGLPARALHIHRLQNRHDVLQQELGIVGSPVRARCVVGVQELEDL